MVNDYCKIPYTRSLLLAVHQADIELRVLRLGGVDYKFIQQSNEILELMKTTCSNLTTLQIEFSIRTSENLPTTEDETSVEVPSLWAYLGESTKLADFPAVAPSLKDMTIKFDYYDYEPFCAAELKQVFASTLWPFLESISMVRGTEIVFPLRDLAQNPLESTHFPRHAPKLAIHPQESKADSENNNPGKLRCRIHKSDSLLPTTCVNVEARNPGQGETTRRQMGRCS